MSSAPTICTFRLLLGTSSSIFIESRIYSGRFACIKAYSYILRTQFQVIRELFEVSYLIPPFFKMKRPLAL